MTKNIAIILTSLILTGCGVAPISGPELKLPSTGHIVPAAPPTQVTVCGHLFTLTAGVVEEGVDNVIPNGSYSTSSSFGPNGAYTPACTYMVLDGNVCQNFCQNHHSI